MAMWGPALRETISPLRPVVASLVTVALDHGGSSKYAHPAAGRPAAHVQPGDQRPETGRRLSRDSDQVGGAAALSSTLPPPARSPPAPRVRSERLGAVAGRPGARARPSSPSTCARPCSTPRLAPPCAGTSMGSPGGGHSVGSAPALEPACRGGGDRAVPRGARGADTRRPAPTPRPSWCAWGANPAGRPSSPSPMTASGSTSRRRPGHCRAAAPAYSASGARPLGGRERCVSRRRRAAARLTVSIPIAVGGQGA